MTARAAGIVTAALAIAAASARADDAADAHFQRGRDLLAAKDADGACREFEEAYRLDRNASGTLLNLGLCNEERGRYATALHWFERALAAAARDDLAEYQSAAADHIRAVKPHVATIAIAFDGTPPPGLAVEIDRERVSTLELGAIAVDPGHHEVVVTAPSVEDAHAAVDIGGPGPRTITIALVPRTIVVDHGKRRRRIAIATASAGVALIAAGVIVGEYAKGKYDDLHATWATPSSGCAVNGIPIDGAPAACNALAARANDYKSVAAGWGTGLFVTGTLAIAGAVALYVTAPGRERVIAPVVAPDRVGVVVGGRF